MSDYQSRYKRPEDLATVPVYLDIETIPCQTPGYKESIKVSPPAKYKKAESIDQWHVDKASAAREDVWRKTALNGGLGEIYCIGWAAGDKDVQCGHAVNERAQLVEFFEAVADATYGRPMYWVGHNVTFDLKFLYHRCAVLGVKPAVKLHHAATPWSGKYYDTMYEWDGRNFVKLAELCRYLGVEIHDEIDGSQVWDAVRKGEGDKVIAHCKADVGRVRFIHHQLKAIE